MKKRLKFAFWIVVVLLLAIQLVPVNRENPKVDANQDFLVVTQAPVEVQQILKESCYDCHSNETLWPWYAHIAPVSFIIKEHVVDGREHLNFSDWTLYDKEDQPGILKHIKKEITNNAMPIAGYTLIHSNAKLSDEQKGLITAYVDQLIENMRSDQNQ